MRILYLPNEYSQQRQREKKAHIYPIRMAMEATYYHNKGHKVEWGYPFSMLHLNVDSYAKIIREPEGLPFLELPKPNRALTDATDYAYNNGNFKYTPGTYIMSASGCWHGKCTFCVERGQPYEVRPVDDVIDEIKECKQMGFREIFDDSATFPVGGWLDDFVRKLGEQTSIRFSCNMRLVDLEYGDLFKAGFRMVLFGIESANQETLDRINKGVKVEDVKYIKKAAEAGLEPHVSCMVGFSWESKEDTLRTINLIKHLLIKGYVKTAQCSFYTPPIDQEQGNKHHHQYAKGIYDVAFSPEFWYNKIIGIRSKADLAYLIRSIKKGMGR